MKLFNLRRWPRLAHILLAFILVASPLSSFPWDTSTSLFNALTPHVGSAHAQTSEEAAECPCAECDPIPTATGTALPTSTATATVTTTAEPTEEPTATAVPSASPSTTTGPTQPTSTVVPTIEATETMIATVAPTEEPTEEPTETMIATVAPTEEPIGTTNPTQSVGTANPTQPTVGSPTATAIVTSTATVTTTAEPIDPTDTRTDPIETTTVEQVDPTPEPGDSTDVLDEALISEPTALVSDSPDGDGLNGLFAPIARLGLSMVSARTAFGAVPQADAVVLPGCKVASVDFVNGYDVIWDQQGHDAVAIEQYTDACGIKDSVEWKDCEKGTKNWPVAYVRGAKIEIGKAVFVLNKQVQLKGEVDVVGEAMAETAMLTFAGKGTPDATGNTITVSKFTTTGALPNQVTSIKNLKITWQLKGKDKDGKDRGPYELASSHPIYVLYGKPANAKSLYLTLADFTTQRAKGQDKSEAEMVAKIYEEFKERKLQRRDLSPATGEITLGAKLLFWDEWTLEHGIDEIDGSLPELLESNSNPRTVAGDRAYRQQIINKGYATVAGLLKQTKGVCGAWGALMVDALGIHGISAKVFAPSSKADFYVGPFSVFPAPGRFQRADLKMLIKEWDFNGGTNKLPTLPYIIQGTMTVDKTKKPATRTIEFVDVNGKKVNAPEAIDKAGLPGQNIANPPGWFQLGDHVLVDYKGKIYDPSYGTSKGDGTPFDNIAQWTAASISGYLQIVTRTITKDDETTRVITFAAAACKLESTKAGNSFTFKCGK